ncbi:hypothetical protein BDD12DRAFT_848099 [Trichophaea hybrida]|nr:hypothetical protein BDD12DRAFT_848099 [Trichophaea hybrida]
MQFNFNTVILALATVSTIAAAAPLEDRACRDKYVECREWASNGFCHNPWYSTATKRKMCAKTCGYC